MPDNPLKVDGDDYLALGADQFTSPQKLPYGKYVNSMNTTSRGGMPQTRPGSQTMMTLPVGNLQGMTVFRPATGVAHIVAAVDGLIYASPYPFTTYYHLVGLTFNAASPFISWSTALKSTDYNTDGELYFLENPYSVLIMQDGSTRAGLWDGTTARHLNPTKSTVLSEGGEIITQPGLDETPMGLWMVWANNRLWLSRGNQVFASDIGNPTKFTETQYINEARSFLLPDLCSGMASTTDQQGIICFTEDTGTFFKSSLQDRTQWVSTPDFQKLILPEIGCIAPRSITSAYGLLWWYSRKGLINQNDALRANISSKLDPQDNPMFETKAGMSYNLTGIAATTHENFVLAAVPFEDKYNSRTMVMDQAPIGDTGAQFAVWSGFWTGWRPVEFAVADGRVYCASVDFDHKNRIWELFTPDRTDNGLPITCNLQTREFVFNDREYKDFRYAEVELRGVQGDLSTQICISGINGAWQIQGTKEVVATHGQVYADSEYGDGGHLLAGSSPQGRIISTIDSADASAANAACVEDEFSGLISKGFSMLLSWSGVASLQAFRLFCAYRPTALSGSCEVNETGPNLVSADGFSVKELFTEESVFTTYEATYTFSQRDPDTGLMVSYTAHAESTISQDDADRKALIAAQTYVFTLLGQN